MVYFENAQYIICIMVIDGCLYVFTIRKISISWSAPLRHQVVCWFCLWNDVMHTEVCWHLESLFCFHTLSCILDREMKQIYWFFFFFLNQRPQGKSYLFFTQFKAEIKGAKIEYASAYVSIIHPVNNTQDAAFSSKFHEEGM